jgi:hypothetical protein
MTRQVSTTRASAGLRLGAAISLPISSVQYQNSRPSERLRHKRRRWLRLSLGVVEGLVVITGSAFPATALAGDADTRPTVTVLVYNKTQASAAILAGAEREAGRILGESGVRAVWLDCLDRDSSADLQELCHKGREPIDVVLRLLPGHIQSRLQDTLFGFTFLPTLASVYYEYAVRLAMSDKEVPTILGCAIAHEVGHLLLGPNSHSGGGIMHGEWGPKEFRLALMGELLFTSQQAKLIRAEARRRMNQQAGTPKEQRLATVDQRTEPKVIPRYSKGSRHLEALIRSHVLKLGMALRCTECQHTSWFSLEDLRPRMSCPHCLKKFTFPSGSPPQRNQWAYRVIGPFTTGGFAGGAYCVGAALNFLIEKVARESNWIPSFTMRDAAGKEFEADFGMLARPSRFSHTSSPHLIIGECKSFNRFEKRDFARANEAANLFPGAILCFCTFNEALDKEEIKGLAKLAKQGRKRMDVGKRMNPVLILTARELFSEFKMRDFYSLYGDKADYARGVYMRDDMQELCEFTQQLYLGMPSYHEWLEEKRRKKAARLAALPKPA